MDNNYRFLIVFIDVLIPFFIGMWLKKKGFSHEWMRCIIRLNVVAVTTVLSVISFWELKITPELLWLPVSVIFICFIPAVFVFLFDRHRFSDPGTGKLSDRADDGEYRHTRRPVRLCAVWGTGIRLHADDRDASGHRYCAVLLSGCTILL